MAQQTVPQPGDLIKVYSTDCGGYFVAIINDACSTLKVANDELLTRSEANELAASLRGQQARMGKASQLVAANAVRKLAPGVYEVRSQTHAAGSYIVRNGQCQCPDATIGGHECKHSRAVRTWERMQEAA